MVDCESASAYSNRWALHMIESAPSRILRGVFCVCIMTAPTVVGSVALVDEAATIGGLKGIGARFGAPAGRLAPGGLGLV